MLRHAGAQALICEEADRSEIHVFALGGEGEPAPAPVRLFVCYAHEDERQLKRLDLMLDILEQQYGLAPWRDRQRLIAGDEWDEEIRPPSAAALFFTRNPTSRRSRSKGSGGER